MESIFLLISAVALLGLARAILPACGPMLSKMKTVSCLIGATILLILLAAILSACAPMPASIRNYGEPKWQPIWTVINRSSGV